MSRQQAKDSRITVAHENMPPFYALTYIIRKERL